MVPGLNGELKRIALVKKIKKDTKLVLVGRKPFENFGIVNPPIYRTSTVLFKNTKELSKAISNIDQQLSQLEQEGQQIVNNIRSQSINPLDPRVQEQVSQVQQQVAAKRNEIEEQKRNLLQQQSQVRELKMDEIVDQGQVDSFCDVTVGDNLIEKMQISITVKDGVIQSIDNN